MLVSDRTTAKGVSMIFPAFMGFRLGLLDVWGKPVQVMVSQMLSFAQTNTGRTDVAQSLTFTSSAKDERGEATRRTKAFGFNAISRWMDSYGQYRELARQGARTSKTKIKILKAIWIQIFGKQQ